MFVTPRMTAKAATPGEEEDGAESRQGANAKDGAGTRARAAVLRLQANRPPRPPSLRQGGQLGSSVVLSTDREYALLSVTPRPTVQAWRASARRRRAERKRILKYHRVSERVAVVVARPGREK